jgi:hypothetical protein
MSIARRAFSAPAESRGGRAEGEEEDEGETEELADLVDRYAKAQAPPNPFLRYLEQEEGLGVPSSATEIGAPSSAGVGSNAGAGGGSGDDGGSAEPSFDVESLVTCWGDYLKAQYHPRSAIAVGGRSAFGDAYGTSESSSLAGGSGSPSFFDAFSYGSQFVNETLQDAARGLLEESDSLQGFQAVVDIDSGFGGLALEYLTYLREECPRAPLLIFGALQPHVRGSHARHTGGVGAPAPDVHAGAFDYASREREAIRDVNIGLAFAAFGAAHSELDATFVPLTAQAYAEAVDAAARAASSSVSAVVGGRGGAEAVSSRSLAPAAAALSSFFPGLHRPNAHKHYQTSAILAAAMDTVTMPFRRNAGFADRVLPVAGYEAERTASSGVRAGDSQPSQHGARESGDARLKHGGGGGGADDEGRLFFDPSVEMTSDTPLVALSSGLTLREFTGLLSPAPYLRTAALGLALPCAHPRASATTMGRVLGTQPPVHANSMSVLQPMSWTTGLPRSWTSEGGAHASSAAPFAHALVLRGVGTHAHSPTQGRYRSSQDAYGRVLDTYLARTPCRSAGHAVFRTPLPLPLTFPSSLFPAGAYDAAGALVGPVSRRPPFMPPASVDGGRGAGGLLGSAYAEYAGVSTPFSTPVAAHLATTPAYAGNLRAVSDAFERRDRSVLHRFAGADRTSASGALDMDDVQAALGGMVDDYDVNARDT